MNKFFDYIFYRIYKQYEKWREDYPYPFAEGVIVVLQIFIIYNILTLMSIVDLFPKKIENSKYYAVFLMVFVYLINHHRYKKKYLEILATYDNTDDQNKERNGVFIVVLIVMVILFPIVIGVLRNNFGYDI